MRNIFIIARRDLRAQFNSPVAYGLPPVLQSGTVTKVHVKDGDEVQAGKELCEFDATIQKADVKQAVTAEAYAVTKAAEAQEGAKQHAEKVKVADQAVNSAASSCPRSSTSAANVPASSLITSAKSLLRWCKAAALSKAASFSSRRWVRTGPREIRTPWG